MPKANIPFYHMNGGEVSRLALARVDMEKMRFAADTMVNWMPLTMGPMAFRPGTTFVGGTAYNKKTKLLEFVYSTTDASLIELNDIRARFWKDDELVSRVKDLSSDIQSFVDWRLTPSPGGNIVLVGAPGERSTYLRFSPVLTGTTSKAQGYIYCTGNHGKKHSLIFSTVQGEKINIRIGSTPGNDDVFATTALPPGQHHLCFIPQSDLLYIEFENNLPTSYICYQPYIGRGEEAVVTLITPYEEADLDYVKYDQSGDYVFIACKNKPPYYLMRGQNDSWSLCPYLPANGPFPAKPGNDTFKFTSDVVSGNGVLTCNKPFFRESHNSSLLRLFHEGQLRQSNLAVQSSYVKPIRVSGVTNRVPITYIVINNFPVATGGQARDFDRLFYIAITGLTGTGAEVELQRTTDPDGKGDWKSIKTYTANVDETYQDDDDNVITYYRLYMKKAGTGNPPFAALWYPGGGDYGICRINFRYSDTQANVQILREFSNITPSMSWRLQEWNGFDDNYPTSVTFHEGRLWWSGGDRIWGSESDNFDSFDFEKIGDAAPISRSIGKGPIQTTNFMLSLNRLVIGTDAGITSVRSSSFDEPLTPTQFSIKFSNTQGTHLLRGLALDNSGVYIQRSNRRVYLITFNSQKFDYQTIDLTRLNIDIGMGGFKDLAIQRQIDTRMLFVRNDGQIACLLFDEADEVMAWYRLQTREGDEFESIATLPGPIEDRVYVVVKRIINGEERRYIEKFARLDQTQDECCAGLILTDSSFIFHDVNTATLTGDLKYLEGATVAVWADGVDKGSYKVSGGSITLPAAVKNAVVGLPYTARYISPKLAFAAASGTAVNRAKRISQIGFVLDRTHYQGVRYGQYDPRTGEYTYDNLPLVEDGQESPANKIWPFYDQQTFDFNGSWSSDSRLYLEAASPRPATVLGVTLEMGTSG